MPTILIIGATSDIGFRIAEKFASEKYSIQLAGRNLSNLTPLQSDLQIRFNISCTIHAFDVMRLDSHNSFYSNLPERPDITVSVVGYMKDNEKVVSDPDETQKTIVTNFTGPVSLLNIVAADYASVRQGTIVGISSVAGIRGRQSNYIYGSAKAGFTAYLSGLRNKLYHSNVHVLTVLPGFVYTRMTADMPLPKLLTASPGAVAEDVYRAVKKKRNIIYVKWFWRFIMLIITSIPESIFKKLKL